MSTDRVVIAAFPRKKRPAWAQWLTAIAASAVLLFLVVSFARGSINWATVGEYLFSPGVLRGLVNTVWMTFLAMAISTVVGTLMAIMKITPNRVLQAIATFYIWLFRGIPQLLQLFLWYNLALVFPTLGIPGLVEVRTIDVMTPLLATALGLGLCQAAYTAEVVRAGIISVDQGQIEAAESMGMSYSQVLRRVVLPQAMRVIIPPIGNYFISMVKLTSLASAIQFSELLYNVQTIYFVNGQVIELLFVATFWYLLVITALSLVQARIERYFSKGVSRTPAKTKRRARVADQTGVQS
jgi:polar amino acid transport system permease protein